MGLIRLMYLLFLSSAATTYLLAVDEHAGHDEEAEHDEHEDGLQLSARDMEQFDIQTTQAGPGVIRNELRVPGEIHMNELTVAHVGPRFSGVVTSISKRLGDTVKAGDILATMETNDTLRPYDLLAPIDGSIVEFHLTLGESMDTGNYAYIIADTSSVWADLRIYQRDLNKIQIGQEVAVFSSKDDPVNVGKIDYIGPVVDENTRTGFARLTLANSQGLYRPGLFILGNIVLEEVECSLVVSSTALISIEEEVGVFVASHEETGAFEYRPVVTGRKDRSKAEIKSGLQAGEEYVSSGGFFLKAESLKAHFGDGHGH